MAYDLIGLDLAYRELQAYSMIMELYGDILLVKSANSSMEVTSGNQAEDMDANGFWYS